MAAVHDRHRREQADAPVRNSVVTEFQMCFRMGHDRLVEYATP